MGSKGKKGTVGVSKGRPKPGSGAVTVSGPTPRVNVARGSAGRMGALTKNAVRPSGS